MSRRPYVRPMKRTWFMDHPYYRHYMLRELTSVFDGVYCLNLFIGLIQLTKGAEAWQSWLDFQANPLVILLTVITLGMTMLHVTTYFDMTPRVLPQQIRKKVADPLVNKLMYLGFAGASVIIFAAAIWV